MRGQARYWVFFVIVAIGLVLSWGQVGRKTQQVIEQEDVVYLIAESLCRPASAPCAAVGGDRALVLGPDTAGLRLEQTGFERGALSRIEVEFLDLTGQTRSATAIDPVSTAWRITGVPESISLIRVSVIGNRERSVAEFPW
jgi:hypothetical protein